MGFKRLLAAVVLSFFAGAASAESISTPGIHSFTLMHDNLTRKYLVFVPASYHQHAPGLPLLIVMHGGAGNAVQARRAFNFEEIAQREGVLIAYPEGTGRKLFGRHFGAWNAGHACCGTAAENNIDDVGFIARMLDDIRQDYAVDAKRVYVTGHSNGSMMAYRLACELSERIAAIAPTGAQPVFDFCSPKRSVPTMHLHGSADGCALFNGGECGGCVERIVNGRLGTALPHKTWPCAPVPSDIERWKRINNITAPAEPYPASSPAMACESSRQSSHAEVVLCVIKQHGHGVPGRAGEPDDCTGSASRRCRIMREVMGPEVPGLRANALMWHFLSKFALP